MKKRPLCLTLAAMILCASSISYAGSYDTEASGFGYSVTVDSNALRISFSDDPEHYLTDAAGKTLLDLRKFGADNPLIDYFDDDIKNQIAGLLPEGSDLDGLAMYEFLSLNAADFEVTGDGKAIIFKFPVACKEGTNVVSLIGLPDDTALNGIKWITLKAEEVNGEVTVYLTDEDLELLMGAEEIIMTIKALRERVEATEAEITEMTGNPSITMNDFGYNVSYNSEIMYLEFRVELPRILTTLAENVLDKLRDHVKTNSVISFFNEIVKEHAAGLLPDDHNLDDLVMYEFASLKAQVFDFGFSDVTAHITFPTEYKDGTILTVLIGVKDLTDVTADTDIDTEVKGIKWLPLKAEAVDGAVKIWFTRESLLLIDAVHNEIMLAVLSEPVSLENDKI